MKQPDMEQTLYCHLELMTAMMKGFQSVHCDTIYHKPDIKELVDNLLIGMTALQIELDRCFEEINERSVCY